MADNTTDRFAYLDRLSRFLNPASIAVVGGHEAKLVIEQCRKLNYCGQLIAINPNRAEIAGIQCHKNLSELDFIPDSVFVAIPAESSIEVTQQLSAQGAAGVVCYASGFSETKGLGKTRQQQLVDAAGKMPVLGPNCWGFINYTSGAALWPGHHGGRRVDRGIAIIAQSGNIAINLSMHQRALPIAWLITVGNQAVSGIEECIMAALQSDQITAIGIHVEGLRNLPFMAQAAALARTRGIALVALKAGKSVIGARLTLSHTASMAGEDRLYEAMLQRLAIASTSTVEEFLETLRFVSVAGPLSGNRITSVSCSGGEASLIADLAESTQLDFPPLDSAHKQAVQHTLNEYVEVDNPLDYHTFIWGKRTCMAACFSALFAGNFDLVIQLIDFPSIDDPFFDEWQQATQAFIDAVKATNKVAALVSSLPESLPIEISEQLLAADIVPMYGMAQAIVAFNNAYKIGSAWQSFDPLPRFADCTSKGTLESIDEWQSKQILNKAGIQTPTGELVNSSNQALVVANHVGYPIVLKAVASELLHKTEKGAVVTSIADQQTLLKRWQHMQCHLQGMVQSFLIERMIQNVVVEMIVAIGWDNQFGHYLNIGFGGTFVELQKEHRILLLPTSERDIMRALTEMPVSRLLNGYRSKPPGDVKALIDCIFQLVNIAQDKSNHIAEIEINPLLVLPHGCGVVAADATINMRK